MLNSILEDLTEDEDREFKVKDDGYYFSSSVNYPNNKSLVRQNVYVDKNGKFTKTEVVDKDGNAQIVMTFKTQEYNKKFDKNYFELSSLLDMNAKSSQDSKKAETDNTTSNSNTNSNTNNSTDTNTNRNDATNQGSGNNTTTNNSSENTTNNTTGSEQTNNTQNSSTTNNNNNTNNNSQESNSTSDSDTTTNQTKTTATINDIVYPMYLPNNTYLTSQEKVATKNGERLILTFGGDSSFVLVEETANIEDESMVIPVSGEFDFLADVIGVIGSRSLTWNSNGIEYYMASEVMDTAELVEIARSISVLPVSK